MIQTQNSNYLFREFHIRIGDAMRKIMPAIAISLVVGFAAARRSSHIDDILARAAARGFFAHKD